LCKKLGKKFPLQEHQDAQGEKETGNSKGKSKGKGKAKEVKKDALEEKSWMDQSQKEEASLGLPEEGIYCHRSLFPIFDLSEKHIHQ